MNVEILVLTSNECPPCKKLTSELTEKGIVFQDLKQDSDESRTFRDRYGVTGSPITVIRSEHDMKMYHGCGRRTLQKIESIAKKHNLFM